MAPSALSKSLFFALLSQVLAQDPPPPSGPTPSASYPSVSAPTPNAIPTPSGTQPLYMTDYHYEYPNVPYQVNPFPVGRGPQFGYNVCNETTAGDQSKCQTGFINSIDDFCLWGSPDPNELTGNIEAKAVAYCTKEGRGTRLIRPGALTGVQFMRTPGYIQVTGHIDQTAIGLAADDKGGELDPHGADKAGNPLGGLVYSQNLTQSRREDNYVQVINWNNFIGGGVFCFKACDPGITSPNFCNNVYDEIGCKYNAPADYKDGEFSDCEGENQLPVGVYVDGGGNTQTWYQTRPVPASIPYEPSIPASSNCRTFKSEDLYAKTVEASATSAGASGATGGASGSGENGPEPTGASGSDSDSGAIINVEGSMVMSIAAIAGTVLGGWVIAGM